MVPLAAGERDALVHALRQAGPGAPTLCEGWQTQDLAAHIVLRDSRPDVMARLHLPKLRKSAQQHMDSLAATDYEQLLTKVAAGPPAWSLARVKPLADLMNTVEFYVHTEDVLRAQLEDTDGDTLHGGDESASAGLHRSGREIPLPVRRALWRQGKQGLFRMAAHKKGQRITFLSAGCGAVTSGPRSGEPLTVTGAPEELILWAFGRESVADIEASDV